MDSIKKRGYETLKVLWNNLHFSPMNITFLEKILDNGKKIGKNIKEKQKGPW